jgi:hypothetical protein
MSLLQEGTLWIYRNETVLTANSPITLPWRNAEALNGGQFFVQYGGAANLKFDLQLSPINANLLTKDAAGAALDPSNAYEELTVLTSGAHGSEGFFKPTSPSIWDDPWKSWRAVLTFNVDMTNVYLALCQNILGGG